MTGRNWRTRWQSSGLRVALARRLGVDARALAALRIALAGLVLADVVLRARFLSAFYTDAGVLPRAVLFEQYGTLSRLSLHALSGGPWLQLVLFSLTLVTALALLVGYRTTLATVLTGVLLASLQYRNPLVLNSGDTLLRMLFLWAVFLPLGRRWSVDALRDASSGTPGGNTTDSAPGLVASVASAGILLQVVLVYATNAVLKLRSDRWLAGDATRYVLELDAFTVLLGDVLTQYPTLLTAVDRLWLAMLATSVLLVVLTGWARAAFAALFASVHLGMLTTMQLGLFPAVSIVALVPFLPPVVWDRLPERQQIPGVRELPVSRYARGVANALPLVAAPSAFRRDELSAGYATAVRWKRRLVPPLLAVLLVGLVAYNAATVGLVGVPAGAPVDESPDPRWGMFAPNPADTDYWVVAPATRESGTTVDAFHGGSVTWTEPVDVAGSYSSSRWRKYVSNLRSTPDPGLTGGFADYLCTRNGDVGDGHIGDGHIGDGHIGNGHIGDEHTENGHTDTSFVSVSVYLVEQPVTLDGAAPTNRVELAAMTCSA